MHFWKLLFLKSSSDTVRKIPTFLLILSSRIGVNAAVFPIYGIFLKLLMFSKNFFRILLISLEVFEKIAGEGHSAHGNLLHQFGRLFSWIVRFDLSKNIERGCWCLPITFHEYFKSVIAWECRWLREYIQLGATTSWQLEWHGKLVRR